MIKVTTENRARLLNVLTKKGETLRTVGTEVIPCSSWKGFNSNQAENRL